MKNDLDFDSRILGRFLKFHRESLGLSLRQLAEASGISHSQIIRIESGEFDTFTGSMVRLCGALALRPGELVEWCFTPSLEFYSKAAADELQKQFPKDFPSDKQSRKALENLACGGAMIVSWLIRVTWPSNKISELQFPSESIKARFEKIAASLADSSLSLGSRAEILNQLQTAPVGTLQHIFRFPSVDQFREYAALIEGPESDIYSPWLPFMNLLADRIFGLPADLIEADTKKESFTDITGVGNTADVKAQWPLLKKRLQKATEATGGKSRLAEFLEVKLSNVSQWLTDHKSAREPSAETALRMLKWVEQQERK